MDALAKCDDGLSPETEDMDHLAKLKDSLIMIVDDEPIMMELVQAFLQEKGYRNFHAIDQSAKALEAVKRKSPDVLLLDLMMPEISGFDILKAIRADKETAHMPVVVFTSSSDAETKLRALELGATDFLAKPVDPSEMALRIRNILTAKAYHDQLAFYDSLTGLPNRKLFLDRLGWAIKLGRREGKSVSVLNIGIDRFRQINDSLGPKAGDTLLARIAERLTRIIRASDIVGMLTQHPSGGENLARLGGDEFSVALFETNRADNAAFVACRILESFRDSFEVSGQEIFITSSIGIAIYPEDGNDTDLLVKHAAAAAIHAKHQGRNNFQFYSKSIDARSRQRLTMETMLRRGIDNGEFELYYQPKIAIDRDQVIGMEALLRWNTPETGLVSPAQFIPVAEETGLIVPLGEWVIGEACRQNKAWQNEGIENLKVSVNVSPHQFRCQKLHETIERAIAASDMDPSWLILEITESMVMDGAEKAIRLLNEIRESGVSLSIDDFGTGYSSFSYLKQLPLDELKIDRSFLIDVPDKVEDVAVTKAIIAMAQALGLSVVAEGVENERQLHFLREQGCDMVQGFYFSKPLTPNEFGHFVRMYGRC